MERALKWPGRHGRTGVRLTSWLVATQVLAGAVSSARAAPVETMESPMPAPSGGRSDERPRPGPRVATLAGALAGVGIGLALGSRSNATRGPLAPLGTSDALVSGAAIALFASPHVFDRASPPSTGAAPPRELNGFDRSIRKLALGRRTAASREVLDKVSAATLTATVLAPVGLLAASNVPEKWGRDLPVVMEATGLSLAISVAVKHVAHRSRPLDRFCREDGMEGPCRRDTRLSFYSGHASAAFAAAVATGSIADDHGFANRRWIWGTQLTLATMTSVLRVMADRHYATDVLVGMATGGLVGWLVPKMHQPHEAPVITPAARSHPPAPLASVHFGRPSGGTMTVTAGVPTGGGVYVGLCWSANERVTRNGAAVR
jgi:membrane-associated phospholipid phosphatase